MRNQLPQTGTAELLALVDPFVPDSFINEHWNWRPTRGPHWRFSAAQLWRTHLLTVLTPVHSLNQVLTLLPEQRAWRGFARLSHRQRVPDARMAPPVPPPLGRGWPAAHQRPVAPSLDPTGGAVEPRRGSDRCHRFGGRLQRFQKKGSHTYTAHRAGMGQRTFKTGQSPWYVGYKKHSLRLWWREHAASVLFGPVGQLGDARQLFRGKTAGAQLALLSTTLAMVA